MAACVEQLSETADWPRDALHQNGAVKDVAYKKGMLGGQTETAARDDSLSRHSRLALLTRVVEVEVLPRLVLAASRAGTATDQVVTEPGRGAATTEAETAELVCLLLGSEAFEAVAFVESLRARGAAPEALFLGIISRAARVLGEMWEDDRCDFTQVTIGTGRLQQVVRALSASFQVAAVRRPQPESVLLLPAPGEQHTFGLVLLGEFFCRAGWHVSGGPAMAPRAAADIVHNAWFDVVGFSVGSDLRLDQLSKSIHALRRASRNRDIGVMVGGPYYIAHPDLVMRVGADSGANDAASAVQQASGMLSLRAAAE